MSRRPKDTPFYQQTLWAWQPLPTPNNVVISSILFGLISLGLGAGFLVSSQNVTEIEIDYTFCTPADSFESCANLILNNATNATNLRCTCEVRFNLPNGLNGPSFIYYGIDNYYQNFRRYVGSRDDQQLRGDGIGTGTGENSLCFPLDTDDNGTIIAPCGLIADSLFNDTIILSNDDTSTIVPVLANNIAWSTDVGDKFRNQSTFEGTATPPSWAPNFNISTIPGNGSGIGFENEDFIVWMRTMALPYWRKLYRRIDGNLNAGNYLLEIEYNYPVTVFGGSKKVYISTVSWLGGKNDFLGIAYLAAGGAYVIIGLLFLLKQCLSPRKLGDPKLLRWDLK